MSASDEFGFGRNLVKSSAPPYSRAPLYSQAQPHSRAPPYPQAPPYAYRLLPIAYRFRLPIDCLCPMIDCLLIIH